eukprot:SAG22_NODE_6211_length_885_cov_1.511450_2_plen_56_part_01
MLLGFEAVEFGGGLDVSSGGGEGAALEPPSPSPVGWRPRRRLRVRTKALSFCCAPT